MKIRILCAAAAALCLSACDDDPSSGKPTRIVCHSGGVKTFDDFASGDVGLMEGGLRYRSRTNGQYTRVIGDCVGYRTEVPVGWTPYFRV